MKQQPPAAAESFAPAQESGPSRESGPARESPVARADDRPGDAVCWLHLVCAECGTMAEAEPPTDCPQCGARIDPGR
jgi:rubrerythrin